MSGYCKKCGNQYCICDEIAKNEGLISNEIERSFQVLELYGVPRDRAHSVHNGIEVLATRMKRENEAIRANSNSIRALLEDMAEVLQKLYDHTKNNMQICGLNSIASSVLTRYDIARAKERLGK